MQPLRVLAAALILSTAAPICAAVIGRMSPPLPLTRERLAALPSTVRPAWKAYLARSIAGMARDKEVLATERRADRPIPAPPPEGSTASTVPLDREPVWYGTAQARRIGDNVVAFQTPAGGWGKNQDRRGPPRLPAQDYIAHDGKGGIYLAQDGAGGWSFVGTLDNDATTTELAFLARVQAALPGAAGDRYRASFLKGVRYLLEAELPGGGWPQVYPLQGGYHDALTLNDDVMLHATEFLGRVAAGIGDYAFVPAATRKVARAATARALKTLLALQVVVNGRRTIWAQQYDSVTRRPVGARNFEPIALATAESSAVLRFLMDQPDRSPAVHRAIEDGAAWFGAHGIRDFAWTAAGPDGRQLVSRAGAGPIWARFYDPATGRPIFGDRDRSIHDDVNALSRERRDGYSWFGNAGASVATGYARWRERRS